jgi:hypothetical protein
MSRLVTGQSSSSNSLSPTASVTAARRRPIPRKGHRKSRAGCLVCKQRKVKCDEVTPECGCCRRLGLTCQYRPTSGNTSSSAVAPSSASVLGAVSRPLRAESASFTIQDLNFFQHFLSSAYPSLPISGWDVWQEVGKMSHHVSDAAKFDSGDVL